MRFERPASPPDSTQPGGTVSDEYDAARRDLSNYERGLYFELGRAHIRGETAEKGWVRQFEIRVGPDQERRRLDSARTEGRGTRSVERKSGRINEVETRKQLRIERTALETGQLTRSGWETVAGERMPATVLADLRAIQRDFPGRFRHEVISRADALRAIEIGRSLASKQLELVRAYELDRADRARKRLANIREIVRQREVKAREERERAEREREAREERARVQRGSGRTSGAGVRGKVQSFVVSRPGVERRQSGKGTRRSRRRREIEAEGTGPGRREGAAGAA